MDGQRQPLRIMTPDFTRCGEIANYSSLQVTRRHYGVGDFELHLHVSTPNTERLEADNIIWPVGLPHKAMVIESIDTKDGTGDLSVKGYLLEGLAKRRVTVPPVSNPDAEYDNFGWDRVNGDAETVMRHYFAANVTAPVHTERVLPRVVMAENQHRGMIDLYWQSRFEPLDEVLRAIGEYTDLGWTIVPDFDEQRYVFDLVEGRDRHESSGSNRRVVFAVSRGNVSEAEHLIDRINWRNVAYVGGAGEDEQRLILSVGDAAGLERRETWVDAGSIDDAEELLQMGQRKLKDLEIKETVSAVALDHGAYRYERDWDMGDRVTVKAGRATMDARITEIKEVYETGKARELSLVFGSGPITLTGIIKDLKYGVVR